MKKLDIYELVDFLADLNQYFKVSLVNEMYAKCQRYEKALTVIATNPFGEAASGIRERAKQALSEEGERDE